MMSIRSTAPQEMPLLAEISVVVLKTGVRSLQAVMQMATSPSLHARLPDQEAVFGIFATALRGSGNRTRQQKRNAGACSRGAGRRVWRHRNQSALRIPGSITRDWRIGSASRQRAWDTVPDRVGADDRRHPQIRDVRPQGRQPWGRRHAVFDEPGARRSGGSPQVGARPS